ncbi:MAG: hypothetical protein LBM20_08800 [Rikenellaceae bacterium]|jgi:TolB protein|nr:hypothetical protein [Rikenellaceae bacterium]
MKTKLFFLLFIVAGLSSCVSVKVIQSYSITEGNENLEALVQITDRDSPCITPFGGNNGQNLFFAASDGGYYNIYYKENVLSTSSSQKTNNQNQNHWPTYSAVLDKIAFNSKGDIFSINMSGRAATQVTESKADESNPDFSPDGTLLIYERKSAGQSEIWTKNLKNGENTLLTNGAAPMFSPDGKMILFERPIAKGCNIWIMNLDGTNQTQITQSNDYEYSHKPCWSPDGKRIIFCKYDSNSYGINAKLDNDLYVVNIDGQNLVQLTENKSEDLTPYWTTDGYIYFASDRGNKKGNYQIWRFKMED